MQRVGIEFFELPAFLVFGFLPEAEHIHYSISRERTFRSWTRGLHPVKARDATLANLHREVLVVLASNSVAFAAAFQFSCVVADISGMLRREYPKRTTDTKEPEADEQIPQSSLRRWAVTTPFATCSAIPHPGERSRSSRRPSRDAAVRYTVRRTR